MQRRNFLGGLTAVCIATGNLCQAAQSTGERLANAARAQLGVTTGYDPTWTYITYPGGDVPRSTGVCADVVIRAARDALGFDLQKLVHEDMVKHFDAYPARRVWGPKVPDTNIDHRRVLNLEAYFQRWQSCLWKATAPTAGDAFPTSFEVGDIITWLLDARLPHIAIVVSVPRATFAQNPHANNGDAHVVHNIGRGVEESLLKELHPHRAVAHYRWPTNT